jgi:lysophospholipase L1-like esterase
MKYLVAFLNRVTLLAFYAAVVSSVFGQNVTNFWQGRPLYQGMPLTTVPSAGGFSTYDAAVLSQSPLVYYPQRETSGTVATDVSGHGYNGTYTSVTLTNTQWVNGDNAPLYNSAGNKLGFLVAGFTNNFNGDQGQFSIWMKPTNTAWTDGTARNVMAIIATSNFQLNKHSTANTLRCYRSASGQTVDLQFTTRALGWFNVQIRWSSSNFVKFYYEGVLVGTDTTHAGAWAGSVGGAQLGTYAAVFQGNLGPTAIYTTTNSDAFVTTLATVPGRITNMMSHIVCDGDSLTLGLQNGATPYPSQLQDLLNPVLWDMRNFGVSGQTLTNMLSDVTTQVDVWHNSIRPREIVILWGGSNDIADGATAAAVENSIQTYCSGRKAAGFSVIACDILPRTGIGGGQETVRTTVNTWLSTNYPSFADGFANLATNASLSNYNDTNYFNADKTHLTTAGYAVVAGSVYAVINP